MILGLLIVIIVCGTVLLMVRDVDDPRDRHPSTGGGANREQPRHVRLIDWDDE